jgi:Beta-carotene isomerase D27-like, C-terminal
VQDAHAGAAPFSLHPACLHIHVTCSVHAEASDAEFTRPYTQTFFTEQLGMPLTMEPDFETYECTMSFGKRLPLVAEDEVARQPCLAGCASAVSSSSASQPCHKLQ